MTNDSLPRKVPPMRIRSLLIALAPVLLVATGCAPKPLNENKTLTLDKDVAARRLELPAPKKAQKITVEFSSSEGEVSVLVFKSADVPTQDAMLTVEASKALASKKGKADTFSVDVPENTETQVVVRGHTAAKTDVTLKVTSAP
jgi:hypothetical protein